MTLRNIRDITEFNQKNRDRWVSAAAKQISPGSRVLDVGAGACSYKNLFANCEYRAHDFFHYPGTREGLNRDHWNYGDIDYRSDITSIPVPDHSFDVVFCTEVLEHVPNPLLALKEMARILKTGGLLFLSAPLGSGLHQQPYHFYGGFTPYFYRKFLPEYGFEILKIESNGGFFRHLLQEIVRAADVIQSRRHYKRRHPLYWLLRIGFCRLIPLWFDRLDDEMFFEEFTVGYHIEARKCSNDGDR